MSGAAGQAERSRALRGAACWGFSATCVSWLTSHGVTVLWLANMRMVVAGLLFLAMALLRLRNANRCSIMGA